MNKNELTRAMATASGMSIKNASLAINSLHQVIATALQNGESISIPGFGSFSVKERPARMGHNPRTGDSIKIAAKKVVRFRPGKTLEIVGKPSKTMGKKK